MTTITYTGRQAITTRWLMPTDTKGGRVVASCEAGRIFVPWDHAHNIQDNHALAVRALCRRLYREADYVGGGNADGTMSWVELPG